MVYDFARGASAPLVVQVIISVGAISAAVGVVQYGLFQYDNLGRRVQGSLGHYMTYSGLADAGHLCRLRARPVHARTRVAAADALAPWPPRRVVYSRNAWVGPGRGVAFLALMKGDLRLIAVVPMVAALFLVLAPPSITERVYSMFDPHDATRLDRVRHAARRGTDDCPRPSLTTGVGPMMVEAISGVSLVERGSACQPASAQRADADRGRARPAGAGGCIFGSSGRSGVGLIRRLVIRRRDFLAAAALSCSITHAGGRTVRIQFRRLGIPDAVSCPHDALPFWPYA